MMTPVASKVPVPGSLAARGSATCNGVPGRIRTCDRPLRRRLLCPLSYGDGGTLLIVRGRVAWHNRAEETPSGRDRRLTRRKS
jgi:hypothetical protein